MRVGLLAKEGNWLLWEFTPAQQEALTASGGGSSGEPAMEPCRSGAPPGETLRDARVAHLPAEQAAAELGVALPVGPPGW